MTPEISKALAELANKLGTSVEYLWPLMVKHALVTSVTTLVVCSIITIACLIAAHWSYKIFKEEGDCLGLMFGAALVAVMFASVALSCIPDIIVPEAAAIKSLLAK